MMRRVCLFLFILCLAVSASAGAAPQPLQASEVLAWRNALWDALGSMLVINNPASTHDQVSGETWLYEFPFGMALLTSPSLDSDVSALVEAEILTDAVSCPRGLRVGALQADVLAAYPNENPDLQGDTGYAALYANAADATGTAGWGWLIRRNQQADAISYTASVPAQGMEGFRQEYTVIYVFADGVVDSIVITGFGNLLTAAESDANLAAVQDIRAKSAYTSNAESGAAFAQSDLQFAGLSFVSASPEDVMAVLGTPQSDTTEEGQGVRTLIYADALIEYASQGGVWTPAAVLVAADSIAGPRNLRVGDTYESVIARFGEGEQGDVLSYAYTDAGGQRYEMACAFVDGILTEYLFYRQ